MYQLGVDDQASFESCQPGIIWELSLKYQLRAVTLVSVGS